MNRPELERQLRALAREHPGEHPYTLALRFQARTGKILSGREVRQVLESHQNSTSESCM